MFVIYRSKATLRIYFVPLRRLGMGIMLFTG